jgi:hypothetical protein
MNLEQVIKQFKDHPYKLQMGAGKLAKWFKCDKKLIYEAKEKIKISTQNKHKKNPRILLLDIETQACLIAIFQKQMKNTYIKSDQIISDWYILSYSYKWLYDDSLYGEVLTKEEVLEENDLRLCKGIYNILDEADIVIVHNVPFDIQNINTRFLIHGIFPPSPYKTVDTLVTARNKFGFTHNNLGAIATTLGFPTKKDTNFSLWKKCMFGDENSLKYMLEYNKQDIIVLEYVYLSFRPYINNHPNWNNYNNTKDCCPVCGGKHIKHIEEKYYYSFINLYNVYRCIDCGSIVRDRTLVKREDKPLITSIPGR